MLEAMALGVPVLATGWSGNMDFTTLENSALVNYRLVDIEVPRSSPYHEKSMGIRAQWADPDVDDASHWMRRLAEDLALRARLADTGRRAAHAANEAFLGNHLLRELASAEADLSTEGKSGSTEILRRNYFRDRIGSSHPADFAARIVWRAGRGF